MESKLPGLRDRVVVVTGGARGMGRVYARAFLSEGAKVAVADRTWVPYTDVDDGVSGFKEELRAHADRVLMLAMDVTSDQQIDRTYQEVLAHFGTVDVLINNAAMRTRDLYPPTQRTSRITTLETADADWEKMFGVNVFGVLKVIRRFIEPMLEKQRGSIVNIVSSGILMHAHGGIYVALRPQSREMPYMASKAALANLSFYLADEVRASNVAVNAVFPAHTRTTGSDEQARAFANMGARSGALRMVPEHVVPLVLFLAGQDAHSITGQLFDALQWNIEHGLGGPEKWMYRAQRIAGAVQRWMRPLGMYGLDHGRVQYLGAMRAKVDDNGLAHLSIAEFSL